ncbi:MAG: hypothetical protein WA102_13420 [Candidatus Methanoperedens sp.]
MVKYNDIRKHFFAGILSPYLLIGLMLIPITFFANWGPIDDWHMLEYLINHVSRMELIDSLLTVGRFYPLYWSEWEILSKVDISPYLFYLLNFLEAFIGCSVLYYIAEKFSNKRTGVLLIVLLILSPAFTESYYRLGVPDKNSFFLFAVGLYFIINYLFSGKSSKMNMLNLLIGAVAINLALYFKEPGFIMISLFSISFVYLLKKYDKINYINNKPRALAILIIFLASSFVFLLLYVLSIHKIDYLYSLNTNPDFFSRLSVSIVVSIGYLLLDPLIIFLGPILLFIRIKNRKELGSKLSDADRFKLFFADSALLAALFYALFYILTGTIYYRYLLPAYAFIIPAYAIYINILFIKSRENNLPLKSLSHKLRNVIMIILVFLLLNSITTGINLIMVYKYVPYNTDEFLETAVPILKNDLSGSYENRTINLFLIGVNRGSGVEYYYSIGTFLNIRGIDTSRFDIKSMDPIDSEHLFNGGSKDLKYTAYQSTNIQIPVSGDYLIVIPFIIYNENDLIRSIEEKHNVSLEQLYKSKNTYYFQIPNGIILGKYFNTKISIRNSEPPLFTNVGYSLYRVK